MTDHHTLVGLPDGKSGKVAHGLSLRGALRGLGISVESVCAENATCGKCKVLVEEGEIEGFGISSSGAGLSDPLPEEMEYIERRREAFKQRGWDPGRVRLSCQARVLGDVAVTVPEESRADRQIVRKSASVRHIDIKPSLRKYLVELTPPSLTNPGSDWDRLASGLATCMALARSGEAGIPRAGDLEIDPTCLRAVPEILRASNWRVTVTVWQDREVVRVQSGFDDRLLGAAVDVGTTTLALYLCDLVSGETLSAEGEMNPQIAFGEDVMSRIQYCLQKSDGLQQLHREVIRSLNKLLLRATANASVQADDVLELVMVGNTTMEHLFLDIPPNTLGSAPFAPVTSRAIDLKARELGLAINPAANVHVLPGIASFIGPDTTAVLLAEEPQEQDEDWLIIDIGTNAELVLGNRNKLICASTPTGPALEGAHIEHGMRAAPGAIERIRIPDASRAAEWKVIGETEWNSGRPKGLCGSAVVDAAAEMYRSGIIDRTGRFIPTAVPSEFIRNGPSGLEYVLVSADRSGTAAEICITQRDIRQIQLAKAALYVAAEALLDRRGITVPDKLLLAGAFGSYIDKANAMAIGMLPSMQLDQVYVVGNAAGDGARIALLNLDVRRGAASVVRRVERHELPADPNFEDRFIRALGLPAAPGNRERA